MQRLTMFALGLILVLGGCSDATTSDPSNSNSGQANAGSLDAGAPDAGAIDDGACEPAAERGAAILAECTTCHSSELSGAERVGATRDVNFDSEVEVARWADRIQVRAVEQRTMPPGAPLTDCEARSVESYLESLAAVCVPMCDGATCGDDGCGGVCGTCAEGEVCNEQQACEIDVCEPDCGSNVCGDDGCGGSCGSCSGANEVCDAGQCACVPACDGRTCGPDGCGGSCGECNGMLTCNTNMGSCVANCSPSCDGKICGDDGCGGSCGDPCAAGEVCSADGTMCECVPQCMGKNCGGDGCGGSCGTCTANNESCGGAGLCVCTPQCNGAVCGPDGCGGTCGMCAAGETCSTGSCSFPPTTWSGDVYPIFQQIGCGSAACHGGVATAAGLDLRSASAAYAALVSVPSSQCNPNRLLVDPGSPSDSYLIDKLLGINLCFGSKMPKMGNMTNAEIDTVRAWIGLGAAND